MGTHCGHRGSLALVICSFFAAAAGPIAVRLITAGELAAAEEPAANTDGQTLSASRGYRRTPVRRSQPSRLLLASDYRSIRLVGDDERFRRVERTLVRPFEFDLAECPLKDLARLVADRTELSVRFDQRTLEDAGLDIDTTVVTSQLGTLPLKNGLRTILEAIDLALLVEDTGVVITTCGAASDFLEPRFYPIAATADADHMLRVIQETVSPESWDVAGSHGHACVISDDAGLGLVVLHTQKVHADIESFLANLQCAAWQFSEASAKDASILRVYRVDHEETRRALAEKLVGLCNESLTDGRDPSAVASVIGTCIVVSSCSKSFHILAGEVIASVSAGPLRGPEALGGMGGGAF